MESMDNPLQVLSNAAAALLETQSKDDTRYQTLSYQQSMQVNCASKELPTKENKMKRSKDRRELVTSSSFRLKRSSSPQSNVDEASASDLMDHSTSPRVNASSPSARSTLAATDSVPVFLAHMSLYKRERSSSSTCLTYRGSPYEINPFNADLHNVRRNSDPASAVITAHQAMFQQSDEEDDEQPLDMSKKTRNSSESESHSSLPRSEASSPGNGLPQTNGQQQMRPSVITCASSLMRTKHTSSPNCQSCGLSADFSKCSADNQTDDNHEDRFHDLSFKSMAACHRSNGDDNAEKEAKETLANGNGSGSKRQILSAICDPVIDEHFRRSLGKDYSEIFQKSQNSTGTSVSTSVDDHFAKALGATWLRLQKGSKDHESDDAENKFQAQSILS